jgi:Sulfotransferase family
MAEFRLPNLVIAGVPKAGTTSLFDYLAQHPDVCPSDVKETRFFDPLRFGEALPAVETYAAHFRHWRDERYALEATPTYFYGGRRAASAIRDILPHARVLVILRDPSERCWSDYRFEQSRGRVPADMDFDAYLSRCEALRSKGVDRRRENRAFTGLVDGCYANWMGDWFAEIGNRLKVVYFDNLRSDAACTVKEICSWLELDGGVVDTFDLSIENKTQPVRSQAVQQVALALNRRAERFFRRHSTVKRRLRALYYVANREPAEITVSESAARRMAEFYAPCDARLASTLEAMGVPPPPWSVGAR